MKQKILDNRKDKKEKKKVATKKVNEIFCKRKKAEKEKKKLINLFRRQIKIKGVEFDIQALEPKLTYLFIRWAESGYKDWLKPTLCFKDDIKIKRRMK